MLSTPVRTLRRLLAATATLTLAVGLAGAAPASATGRDARGGAAAARLHHREPAVGPAGRGRQADDGTPGRAPPRRVHHRGPRPVERRPGDVGARLPRPGHGALAGAAGVRAAPAAAGAGVRLGVVVVRPQRLRHPLRGAGHQGSRRPVPAYGPPAAAHLHRRGVDGRLHHRPFAGAVPRLLRRGAADVRGARRPDAARLLPGLQPGRAGARRGAGLSRRRPTT